ncbi:hypothetical protein CXR47_25870 [Vibrio parahaemolyticus]|nr:hypothetical protein CXR47_25870 [Vibrio parahaemolyticus]
MRRKRRVGNQSEVSRFSNLTKRLRRIHNARHSQFASALVFTAQWFRSGGMRCSPLNAALAYIAEF